MHHSEVRARQLIQRLRPGEDAGAEVGVWAGEMSAHLLRLCAALHLTLVDSWLLREARAGSYVGSGDFRARCPDARMLEAMRATKEATAFAVDRRRIIRAASVDAAAEVPDGSLDFVFIDAEHTYEAVTADIAAWLPKIRPGGLMSGHDYSPAWWPGVVRAVDEFVAAHGLALDVGVQATWFVRLP